MKNKLLSFLLMTCLIVAMLPCSIYAESNTSLLEIKIEGRQPFTIERTFVNGEIVAIARDLD